MSVLVVPLCAANALSQDDACASAHNARPENKPSLCHPPCQPLLDARRQAACYKAHHQRARQREDRLKLQLAQLQAENRDLRHRLFGRSSEVHYTHHSLPDDAAGNATPVASDDDPVTVSPLPPSPAEAETPRRPRGQQRGTPSHGRRDYSSLPTREEVRGLPDSQCCCLRCGQPFAPFPGTDDTTVLEVEVKPHRRLIHRQRYQPTCTCGVHPGVLTAPPPPRLIPKSPGGVSLWVHVLLDKYLFHRPTQRLLADGRRHGLDLSQGTLTGGLQRLLPLFEPLYDALIGRSQQQTLWHADETRGRVFQRVEGKIGYHWYLWVFHADEGVGFVRATSRSHTVPEAPFGPAEGGILGADRYAAYPAIDKVKAGSIVLAFCWAHQRRDFVERARRWPDQRAGALGWLKRIRALYRLNGQRLQLREDSEGFEQRDRDLRAAVTAMAAQAEQERKESSLRPARRKVLESRGEHWTGRTVFVEHPEVPMDNNAAERAERAERGPEELLGFRFGVGGPSGSDAVLAVSNRAAGAVEPACLADVVSDGVRGGGRQSSCGRGVLPAVESVSGTTRVVAKVRHAFGGGVGEKRPNDTS